MVAVLGKWLYNASNGSTGGVREGVDLTPHTSAVRGVRCGAAAEGDDRNSREKFHYNRRMITGGAKKGQK